MLKQRLNNETFRKRNIVKIQSGFGSITDQTWTSDQKFSRQVVDQVKMEKDAYTLSVKIKKSDDGSIRDRYGFLLPSSYTSVQLNSRPEEQ